MKLSKYLEFVQDDFEPIKSFQQKSYLNPKIWTGDGEIDEEIRQKLLKIANDFYQSTDLDAKIKDITLTGSLANYNWSKYSDFDLHILIDFSDVNEDTDFVKKFVDYAKNLWNKENDIEILGYEVEVYIQDVSEKHGSSGIFSLLKDKWDIKPKRVNVEIDESQIREKAKSVMMSVDDLSGDLGKVDYDTFKTRLSSVWEKVKKYRKSSLDSGGGEYAIGNLVFKLLRRNGYIGRIMKMKRESYAEQFRR